MDFRQTFQPAGNRGDSPVAGASNNNAVLGDSQSSKKDNRPKKGFTPAWLSILSAVIVVGAALLLLATAIAFVAGRPASEEKQVNSKLYQAVFLNNGQVYFGSVKDLNARYVVLEDVFYLTQSSTGNNTTAANTDYTLVKLGCQQIHFPEDRMVINREQVTFWENLKSDGKVVKSIAEFKKQNPNGENCSTTTNQTQSSSNSTQATQSSTNGTSNTNNNTNTNTNNNTSTNP